MNMVPLWSSALFAGAGRNNLRRLGAHLVIGPAAFVSAVEIQPHANLIAEFSLREDGEILQSSRGKSLSLHQISAVLALARWRLFRWVRHIPYVNGLCLDTPE